MNNAIVLCCHRRLHCYFFFYLLPFLKSRTRRILEQENVAEIVSLCHHREDETNSTLYQGHAPSPGLSPSSQVPQRSAAAAAAAATGREGNGQHGRTVSGWSNSLVQSLQRMLKQSHSERYIALTPFPSYMLPAETLSVILSKIVAQIEQTGLQNGEDIRMTLDQAATKAAGWLAGFHLDPNAPIIASEEPSAVTLSGAESVATSARTTTFSSSSDSSGSSGSSSRQKVSAETLRAAPLAVAAAEQLLCYLRALPSHQPQHQNHQHTEGLDTVIKASIAQSVAQPQSSTSHSYSISFGMIMYPSIVYIIERIRALYTFHAVSGCLSLLPRVCNVCPVFPAHHLQESSSAALSTTPL